MVAVGGGGGCGYGVTMLKMEVVENGGGGKVEGFGGCELDERNRQHQDDHE